MRRRRHPRALGELEGQGRPRQDPVARRVHLQCAHQEISEALCRLHGWHRDGRRRRPVGACQPPRGDGENKARDARSRPRLLSRCRRHLAAVAFAGRDRHLLWVDRPDHERAGRDPRKICRCGGAVGKAAGAARGADEGSARHDFGGNQQADRGLLDRRDGRAGCRAAGRRSMRCLPTIAWKTSSRRCSATVRNLRRRR